MDTETVQMEHDAHPGAVETVTKLQFEAVWSALGWREVKTGGEPAKKGASNG